MVSAYGAQLAILTDQLAAMCKMVGSAMDRATTALLEVDLALAEQVIGGHAAIVAAGARVEEDGLVLLGRHAPLGRNLRAIVGAVQIVADIERMGVLARHIAEIARRRHPRSALPEGVNSYFAEMARIALDLAANANQVIASCDLGRARYIRDADEAMDRLHRQMFTVMMDGAWDHGTTAAVDVTLLSRYYERFADHAVEISRRVIFQATGQARDEERILAHY